jgi:hypothetical protein
MKFTVGLAKNRLKDRIEARRRSCAAVHQRRGVVGAYTLR